ncbi:hypothetical protein JW756_03435 [Candidatus Woesearchaeota archaeon]|nr:hypothetical protein [Candidatus Woesearchaeota archaeon]
MKPKLNILKSTNRNLEGLLLNENNIELIEALLLKYFQEFMDIEAEKRKGKLDFGPKLSNRELKEVFPSIKADVDDFLGLTNIPTPRFGYHSFFKSGGKINFSLPIISGCTAASFLDVVNQLLSKNAYLFTRSFFSDLFITGVGIASYYHVNKSQNQCYFYPLSNNITLLKDERAELIPAPAHEYTHYIQEYVGWKFPWFKGFNKNKRTCLAEGHAMGVENYLARTYAEREKNPAFLYNSTRYSFYSLASVYYWICNELNIKKRNISLSGIPERPSDHTKGRVLFLINETKYGPQIYSDILKGKFELK